MRELLESVALIAILTVVAIFLGYWTMGFVGIMMRSDVEVQINPSIFSGEYNIGVLNELSHFSIYVKNNSNVTREISVVILSEDSPVDESTFEVLSESTKNLTLTQKLSYIGNWVVKVADKDIGVVDSYSFITVKNEIDATIQINALKNIERSQKTASDSNAISFCSLIVSLSSLAISAVALYYSRKEKNTEMASKT